VALQGSPYIVPQVLVHWRCTPAVAVSFFTSPVSSCRVPAGWVTGGEVYDSDLGLLSDLEHRQMSYVLSVACDQRVSASTGQRADALAARLPRCAWQRYSAGTGAKGYRYYDWAWLVIDPGQPGHRWLLIRRNRTTRLLAPVGHPSPRSPARS
jgi:hypothetical protein